MHCPLTLSSVAPPLPVRMAIFVILLQVLMIGEVMFIPKTDEVSVE